MNIKIKQGGFTLSELLAVLAIFVILSLMFGVAAWTGLSRIFHSYF